MAKDKELKEVVEEIKQEEAVNDALSMFYAERDEITRRSKGE